jgi:hypothetical protein
MLLVVDTFPECLRSADSPFESLELVKAGLSPEDDSLPLSSKAAPR